MSNMRKVKTYRKPVVMLYYTFFETEMIGEYHDKKPEDYVIVIAAKKVIWNYYVVESWSIEKAKGKRSF